MLITAPLKLFVDRDIQANRKLIVPNQRIFKQAHILKPPRKTFLQDKKRAEIPTRKTPLRILLFDIILILRHPEIKRCQNRILHLLHQILDLIRQLSRLLRRSRLGESQLSHPVYRRLRRSIEVGLDLLQHRCAPLAPFRGRCFVGAIPVLNNMQYEPFESIMFLLVAASSRRAGLRCRGMGFDPFAHCFPGSGLVGVVIVAS